MIMIPKTTHRGYDLIGDVHGHAAALESLLGKLGYREKNGCYRHPEGRRVIFLGDFIDRGPDNLRVLRVAKAMVDRGSALAVLGNHEFNALRYHTCDSDGEPFRPHSLGKRAQHAATLEQVADPHPAEWAEYLRWFAGLPVALDLGELRAVHACWDECAVDRMRGWGRLEGMNLERCARPGSPGFDPLSRLLNGAEIELPEGEFIVDACGKPRNEVRVRWWCPLAGLSYREAIFPESAKASPRRVPDALAIGKDYPETAPPTFFGHYAVMNGNPEPLLPNLACLDYGMGKGGPLCAYRWDGEQILRREKFFEAN